MLRIVSRDGVLPRGGRRRPSQDRTQDGTSRAFLPATGSGLAPGSQTLGLCRAPSPVQCASAKKASTGDVHRRLEAAQHGVTRVLSKSREMTKEHWLFRLASGIPVSNGDPGQDVPCTPTRPVERLCAPPACSTEPLGVSLSPVLYY